MVLKARVIEFAHVDSKLAPEGCQPCSTWECEIVSRPCTGAVIVDADMLGSLRAPCGSVQLRRDMMTSGRPWSERNLYSRLGERGGKSIRQRLGQNHLL